MAASPVSTDIAPWPFALALFIAMLAAFVALDLAKRVRVENAEERGRWLVASSVSLGSGLWAAQALAVGGLKLAYPVGQHTMGALAVWVFALAVTAGSLMLAWSQLRSWPHLLGSAVLLGTGVVATQMAGVAVMGLQPGVSWRSPQLAAALGLACAGTGTAYMLYFQSQVRAPEAARRWQALAAIFLGMAMLASQQMVFSAAQLNLQFYSAYEGDLRSDTLAAIGSVGALAMLVALQALSFLEARMRTSLDNANSELRKQSHRDETTGLPNRQTFEDTLALAVREADKKQGRLALMYIALDGFRHVNETYGHHAGDLLLREMAGRLRALAEPQRVARLGGDEFLLLLADNPEKRSVTAAAAQVLQMLGRPYSLQGKDVSATCSIGVVLYPQHGAASTLISHAHVAMRASKSAGGATYSFFDLRLVNEAREQTELLRDLRLALAREQLELFYQPKVHAQSGQITGVESLIRWHHPERGLISPAVFIPLAERFGLICAIGAWVIDAACKQLSTWCDQGLRMRVAINISAHQLRQPDLIDQLTQALERHKVDPHLLTCEITESVAMEDTEATLKLLHAMAKVGLQISIDDFGSGFSSLAYLRVLPANELKIDRGFVLDLETSEEARKVAAAVVNLAKALQMKVVAEGVETEGQHEILRKLGCDQLQGFLFAKPMSAKALGLWAMQSHSPGEIAFRDSLYVDTVPAA